jgi:hypothetical protein
MLELKIQIIKFVIYFFNFINIYIYIMSRPKLTIKERLNPSVLANKNRLSLFKKINDYKKNNSARGEKMLLHGDLTHVLQSAGYDVEDFSNDGYFALDQITSVNDLPLKHEISGMLTLKQMNKQKNGEIFKIQTNTGGSAVINIEDIGPENTSTKLVTEYSQRNNNTNSTFGGKSTFTGDIDISANNIHAKDISAIDISCSDLSTNNLYVTGNLTIIGDTITTTTTINSTNLDISDNIITLNSKIGDASYEATTGIIMMRGGNTNPSSAFMGWVESEDRFVLGLTNNSGSTLAKTDIIEEYGDLWVSDISATDISANDVFVYDKLFVNNENVMGKISSNSTNISSNSSSISSNSASISSNKTIITSNSASISSNKTIITSNSANISTNKTIISSNSASISSNKTIITSNSASISSNKTSISTNSANISSNSASISSNSASISSNDTRIKRLNTVIGYDLTTFSLTTRFEDIAEERASNSASISSNKTIITSNSASITSNKTIITSNSASITSNSANISTNSASISSNKTIITSNSASISSNKTIISTNSTNISTNIQDITDLSDSRVRKTGDTITGDLTVEGTFKQTNGTTILNDLSACDASFNDISAVNIYFSGTIYQNGNEFNGGGEGTTINKDTNVSLNNLKVHGDLSANDASFNNIQFFGKILKSDGSVFKGGNGDGEGISGSGIAIRGGSTDTDISKNNTILNDSQNGFTTKDRNEGEIIYDSSKNIFFEASRSKTDEQGGGDLAFRPLGYSFFGRNMEGQPPPISQDSFFFFLTSKTIVIKWTNPEQYHTGLTGATTGMTLSNVSPIVTVPISSPATGGQIWFPIVNRIMIQIRNLDDEEYQTWGTNTSSKSNTVFPNGRVICEKDRIIPPALNGSTSGDYFGPTYTKLGARTEKKHKLKDFANSIILYKDKSIPDTLEGTDATPGSLIEKRVYSAKQDSDTENEKYTIPDSENGYEIKIWLENQYDSGPLTENDFNVVTLRTMDRIMDETGNEITSSSSNSLKNFIKKPIKFLTVDPPTRIRVADYGATDGFHVKLKRITNTTIHYLECIIPRDAINPTDSTKKNEDNKKVESTSSDGQENEVYFKGYFIEFQTIEADTNATKTLTQLATEFGTNGTSWAFVPFETFNYNSINFTADTNSSTGTMATDTEATLDTVIYPSGISNVSEEGFIAAAPYNGGFSTKTSVIDWSTSKAFRLNQGDNKFYRFRIRGVNNGNKNAGPVSTKYFYFRFNEPEQITWKTPAPKFNAGQLNWGITLNWDSISKSSKDDNNYNSYDDDDLAIMEYKLQRRDAASESWQTISYWKNANNNPTTQNYIIWPTPVQTKDSNYTSNSQTASWSTTNDTNKAEWVYYEATVGGTKVYTQEARLLETDKSTAATYKDRNPSFLFRIQARNYLFGKRVDANASNAIIVDIKQWFIEGTLDTTNSKNITDTRWSANSLPSTALVTTAHTTGYTPLLQANADGKYEIKFYEQDSADTKSPWKNSNNVTDYDDAGTRLVKYTTDYSASRNTTNHKPYNDVPDNDYIAYQWKITDEVNKTTVDSTTGLSIDRYEIIETINMGTTASNTTIAQTTPTTIIYSPDFRYGPANWHINEYTPFISASPSFKFKVKAYNFFNSTSSNSSTDSTTLSPTKPSPPNFLSTASGSEKVSSTPTFTLTDDGITILVDEPVFTGQIEASGNYYQAQAITISEFKLRDGSFNTTPATSMSASEITLINSHGTTSRSVDNISGVKSQVATFFHPIGYTADTADTELKDLTSGRIEYTFHAKNVLKNEFSDPSSCTLTIGKPSPTNFKYCPKFTWQDSDNTVKLEFFRTISDTNTKILKDGASSTIAPLSDVTPGCNVSNGIQNLAWEVRCADVSWNIVHGISKNYIPSNVFSATGNNNADSAHTILNIYIEDQSKNRLYNVDYQIRNQYNRNYFASTELTADDDDDAAAPLKIKLTAPNTIGGISSKVTYALENRTDNNKLQIDWTPPTEYGLHYKHEGGTLTAQTQPNIKTYKVYFNDAELWYVYTITASSHEDATDDLTITSGSTGVEKWSNEARNAAAESHTIRIAPGKTYTIEKITAINWLYDSESPAQESTISATGYDNGTVNDPPKDGSTTVTDSNAPTPAVFDNYDNSGILISTGSTVRRVKILGAKEDGTPLTSVLLNAHNVKGTSSTMGIKITITGATTTTTSESKFGEEGIVTPNSSTLTYTWGSTTTNLAEITMGNYKDLYKDATSATDNQSYWFINDSIKLKWLATASEITDFYGKNLTFSVVVTYYNATGTAASTLTKQIETGYYDKTISAPSIVAAKITPVYTPYTCLGLPILHSSDVLTVATEFDNKSSTWVASTDINTITLRGIVLTTSAGITSNALTFSTNHGLSTGDTVKYSGGTPISGLVEGTVYYVIKDSLTKIKLATVSATTTFINITGGSAGNTFTHTIASKTTVKNQHTLTAPPTVSLTAIDMGAYTGTSLVKNAQITVKVKNCHSSPTAVPHSGKYIYDPKTVDLIETIGRQNLDTPQLTISTSTPNAAVFKPDADETFTTLPLYNVLKIPDNFDPISATAKYVNSSTAVREDIFGTLDITGAGIAAAAVSGVVPPSALSQVLIYDGKFVSENYFRTNFGTSGANYHGNVAAYIDNVGGDLSATDRSTHCTTSGGDANDTLEKNYRWGLFSMKFTNKKAAAASVFGGEFLLGSDSYCNFTPGDLIPTENFGVANVEIWYKVININRPNEGVKLETRWNKLCNNNGATNLGIEIADMVGTKTYLNNPSSGWILNSDTGTATAAFADAKSATESASSNIEWKDNKRIQFVINQVSSNSILSQASGADRGGELIILIAIGIKNNVSRFYSIPRMSGTLRLYKGTGTGTLYHGLSTTTYLD